MNEKNIRDIINKILSDYDTGIVLTTDDVRKYMPYYEESESDPEIRELLKCTQETIYYYRHFQKAFNCAVLSAPDIETISKTNIGFKKFKGLLNDKQRQSISFVSGDDIVTAARRYRDAVTDSDFFYNQIFQWHEFMDRYKDWMDGGSMWVKFQNEKTRSKMPYSLMNMGFIDEHDVPSKKINAIRDEIIKRVTENKYSSKTPPIEEVSTAFERISNEVYNREYIYTNRTITNAVDGSGFKIRYVPV